MKDVHRLLLKLNGSSGFKVERVLSYSSHKCVNFCLNVKDKVSKLRLKIFLSK